uniref:Putative ovule protein n=1 Tax=Solanum chacoense TaxID=4108 RepID=A0A0V0HXQ1_SOLCH
MVAMVEFYKEGKKCKLIKNSQQKPTIDHHNNNSQNHGVDRCKPHPLGLSSLFFLACIITSFVCCKKNPMPYWFLYL